MPITLLAAVVSLVQYQTGHISVMIYLLVTEHVVFDRFINKSTTKIPSRTSPSLIYRRKITFNIYHVTDSFLLQSLPFFFNSFLAVSLVLADTMYPVGTSIL